MSQSKGKTADENQGEHAGPAFLQSRDHLSSGDDGQIVIFSEMKNASSNS